MISHGVNSNELGFVLDKCFPVWSADGSLGEFRKNLKEYLLKEHLFESLLMFSVFLLDIMLDFTVL